MIKIVKCLIKIKSKYDFINQFFSLRELMFGRNFFINKNNGVCYVCSGWLVVKEKINFCEWDKYIMYF